MIKLYRNQDKFIPARSLVVKDFLNQQPFLGVYKYDNSRYYGYGFTELITRNLIQVEDIGWHTFEECINSLLEPPVHPLFGRNHECCENTLHKCELVSRWRYSDHQDLSKILNTLKHFGHAQFRFTDDDIKTPYNASKIPDRKVRLSPFAVAALTNYRNELEAFCRLTT